MNEHRYTVWVAGNCASVRLARQLASDALVLKLVSPEIEWYYPLLKPGEHYLPVWVEGNETGLPEVVSWAKSHPLEVQSLRLKLHKMETRAYAAQQSSKGSWQQMLQLCSPGMLQAISLLPSVLLCCLPHALHCRPAPQVYKMLAAQPQAYE